MKIEATARRDALSLLQETPILESYSLADLKLVYRILHGQLTRHTDLLDSVLFEDLQRHLQRHAQTAGVDVTDHGAWDAWLGNEPVSCAVRMEKRSTLN